MQKEVSGRPVTKPKATERLIDKTLAGLSHHKFTRPHERMAAGPGQYFSGTKV